MLDAQGRRQTSLHAKPVADYDAAWYRRTFFAPDLWRDRDIELHFEHIKGNAIVYVNGQEAGRLGLPSGSLRFPIGSFLLPGRENEIRVFTALPPDAKDRRVGLFGDTWLTVKPGQNFGTPLISTSVRKKNLTLQLEHPGEGGQVSLRILDRDKVVTTQEWPENPDGKYELAWIPEQLWSPDTPKLFIAEVTLRNDGRILDQARLSFGFREFWTENGEFILNGNKLLLKADSALPTAWSPSWVFDEKVFRDDVALAKKMNLNALLMGPETPVKLYDIADEEGILILQKGLIHSHADRDLADKNPDWWQTFEEEARLTLGNPMLKNHPSLIAWIIDIWYNFHSGTANPEYIGMESSKGTRLMLDETGKPHMRDNVLDPNIEQGIPRLRKEHLDRVIKICQKYAPEFAYFTNGSGHAGEVFSTHIYHTWGAPRNELKALFERWKQEKHLPIYGGEISQPYLISFYDLEKAHNGGQPYFLENGARLFGNDAYLYDGVYTLRPFHDLGRESVFANKLDDSTPIPSYFFPEVFLDSAAVYTDVLFPAWRADGFTGFGTFGYVREGHWATAGIPSKSLQTPIPDTVSRPGYTPQTWARGDAVTLTANPLARHPHFRLNIIAPPLARAMQNFTLIVAGPEEDPYLSDHAYFTDQRIEKTVILANDSPKNQNAKLEVGLHTASGRLLKKEVFELTVPAREQIRKAISFPAPAVAGRTPFHLYFRLLPDEGSPLRDQRAIEVFSRSDWQQPRRSVALFDPEGKLATQLTQAGIHFTKLDSLTDKLDAGILILGRNALSATEKAFDPHTFLDRGISVLVMEQTPDVSPELMAVRQREVYIESPSHPILSGLQDADFMNWSGNYGNSPKYAPAQPGQWWTDWGHRNTVSTSVFRRPYGGGFSSLLVSGFDLYQSPLLEYRGEKASWIASQLDITDRIGSDPVPTLLFQRMLAYLDNDGSQVNRAAIVSGEPHSDFFQKLQIRGLQFSDARDAMKEGMSVLIIRDADFEKLREAGNDLADFVYWGGRVIYLQGDHGFDGRWLPFPMKLEKVEARQAVLRKPDWNDGWNNNDLYWRDKYTVPVFSGFPSQFDATDPAVVVRRSFGSGEYWFVSLTPELFGNALATAKTTRVIGAILSQNGVTFQRMENPYQAKGLGMSIDLRDRKWEFRTDPTDVGLSQQWQSSQEPQGWLKGLIADGVEVRVGVPWESFLKDNYDGIAWYRLNMDIPRDQDLYLNLGPIDDFDQVFFNGTLIGKTDRSTPKWWNHPRTYMIPKSLIREKGNLIVVRVEDESGLGGIKAGPVTITSEPPRASRMWSNPYSGSDTRDYLYDPDVVRMY